MALNGCFSSSLTGWPLPTVPSPEAVVGIPGGLGQLSHGVEHNGAAALAGGAHQIGIGPVGGGEDRVVEELALEQWLAGEL